MFESIITSTLAFVSTNIDDIFIIMLFFGSKRFTRLQIIAGQYAGIVTLVTASFALSLVGKVVDPKYIGLLGLFPIYLAVKQIIHLYRNKEESNLEIEVKKATTPIIAMAGVTIANGSDNIGIYVPLLSEFNEWQKVAMVLIFMLMTLVWCFLGIYLSTRPFLAKSIEKYGHIVMPIVFLFIGGYIVYESDVLSLLK